MLSFNPEIHEYRWEGAVVPHVTRIIAPLTNYDKIPQDVLERARQQGQAVHKMVEADLNGTLLDLPEWMFGHFDAWNRFKEESGFECWASEQYVYSRRLGFAGTLDLAGIPHKLKKCRPSVIDVKRSFYAGPAIGLQTVGYQEPWNETHPEARLEKRFALRLDADGKYRLEPFEDPDDRGAFIACLQQLRWKEKHYGHRT